MRQNSTHTSIGENELRTTTKHVGPPVSMGSSAFVIAPSFQLVEAGVFSYERDM